MNFSYALTYGYILEKDLSGFHETCARQNRFSLNARTIKDVIDVSIFLLRKNPFNLRPRIDAARFHLGAHTDLSEREKIKND